MSGSGGEITGMLHKWTNYWGGWQPRWFVLSHGILAYYNSPEEADKGCKASINISAGEIKVNDTDYESSNGEWVAVIQKNVNNTVYANDNTRFDIILQHEQHWYLRASTPAERQKWLIAIGTIKAGSIESRTKKEKETREAKNELQSRVSELRLYCDLLVHQVVQVKQEAQNEHPDPQKLTEVSSLLSATCDTFLGTLGQCLSTAETTFNLPSIPGRIGHQGNENHHITLPYAAMHRNKVRKHRRSQRSVSVEVASNTPLSSDPPTRISSGHTSAPATPLATDVSPLDSDLKKLSFDKSHTQSATPENKPRGDMSESTKSSRKATSNDNSIQKTSESSEDQEDRLLTFFAVMLHSFTDITLEEDGGIPTDIFLSACESLMPFLDTIGSTAFAPVKMDFTGNISKIKTKYLTSTARFSTLQGIVQQEVDSGTTKVRNSATDALLWLKRGLRFIQQFLNNVKNGDSNLTAALNNAYSVTLKRYHGWVIKGIFALAVKAAPYRDDFIRALSPNINTASDPRFHTVLMQDIDEYVTAIDVVLNIVDNFYERHGLDVDTVVG